MPIWRFRSDKISYPGHGLLECVLRARGMELGDVKPGGAFEPPGAIAGMDQVSRRIARAVADHEKVMVFGDFDCDGVCGAYILTDFLNRCGARAEARFPSRLREGYGIRPAHVEEARLKGFALIVTVDNGITAFEAVEAARALGVEILITDHHEPDKSLPGALIADPKLPGSKGFRYLSGAGVAWKLCCAVSELTGCPEPREYLDLVCLATVVDVCPLAGENFRLARRGLVAMRENPRPGLAALLSVASNRGGSSRRSKEAPLTFTGYSLAWIVGPRINAAGRLEDIVLSYRLLASRTIAEAEPLARRLDGLNAARIKAVERVMDECLAAYDGSPFAVFASPEYELGIVGVAAGRVAEAVARPAAVGSVQGGKICFSARSVGGFHLYDALRDLQSRTGLLCSFGGHAQAVGFIVGLNDLSAVKSFLNRIATERLRPEDLAQWIEVDARLDAVPTPEEVAELDLLEPYGADNPAPVLYVTGRLAGVRRGDTWSLATVEPGLKFFTAKALQEGEIVHAALTLAVDDFRGERSLIGHAADVRSFMCSRQDLLGQYSSWRRGTLAEEWAVKIFEELGLTRNGENEKTSLFKSTTFLAHGIQVATKR
jgi:single-stranded-DNA-specific exonuclease